jgi:hypothetical protein
VDIVVTSGCLPKHYTAEGVGILLNVGFDKWLGLLWGQVEASVSGSLRCRKTDEKLRIGVGAVLNDTDPVIEVEFAGLIDPVSSRAALGVVPLDPDEVEVRVGNGITELGVGKGALRSTGDVELATRDLVKVPAQTVDHGGVSYLRC